MGAAPIPSIGIEDVLLIGQAVSTVWKVSAKTNHLAVEPKFRKKCTARFFRDQALICLSGPHRGKVYKVFSFEMSAKIIRTNTSSAPIFEPFEPFWLGIINRSYTQVQTDDFIFLEKSLKQMLDQDTPENPSAPEEDIPVAATVQPPTFASLTSGVQYPSKTAAATSGKVLELRDNQVYAVFNPEGQIISARRVMAVTNDVVFRELGVEVIRKPEWMITSDTDPKRIKRQKQPATVGKSVFLNWLKNTNAVLVEDAGLIEELEMIGS